MPITCNTAMGTINTEITNAVNTWNALAAHAKTYAKWKELFGNAMDNVVGYVRISPGGDPNCPNIPPPPPA